MVEYDNEMRMVQAEHYKTLIRGSHLLHWVAWHIVKEGENTEWVKLSALLASSNTNVHYTSGQFRHFGIVR